MPIPSKTKANLGAAWMTDNDIRAALAKIHHNRNQHDNMVRKAAMDLNLYRQQLENSLSTIDARDRNSAIGKAIAGRRTELSRQSKDARLALTRELVEVADRIKSAEAHYRSPIQMLMRDTLGDERRSRIQSQIEQSGPVELASLAELAAATRDKASSSGADSTLNWPIPADSANSISARVFPTPEKTMSAGFMPAANARASSPLETTSAP